MRVEHICNSVTLYCGDCREILPTLGRVDAVVTDPPYGVNLGANGPSSIGKTAYLSFDDTPENVRDVCIPVIQQCIDYGWRCVLTPGTRNVRDYPPWTEMGCIFNPAGAGFSRWGFTTSQPILYYGKDPYGQSKKPQSFYNVEVSEKNGHPCPKPIGVMKWLVNRASLPNEIVLDPFMGSGTTGVAAVKLGRQFIGIEIEPSYFDIAYRRIEEAARQPDMFIEQRPAWEQATLALPE